MVAENAVKAAASGAVVVALDRKKGVQSSLLLRDSDNDQSWFKK